MVTKLLRTSTFRLALLYLLLFSLSVLVLLGYIYWTTAGFMERQTRETIDAETQGLAEQYRLLGLGGLVRIINNRVSTERARDSLYLLADQALAPVAGNLSHWPADELSAARADEGWTTVALTSSQSERPRHAILRHFRLTNGFHLLVGRDVSDRFLVQQIIIDSLFWGMGMTVVLGLVGGVVMSRGLLARIEVINQTSQEIMAGDLTRRMPTEGTRDEFDQLAENLNQMLDRIGDLLDGFRRVSDNIAHDLRTPLNRLRSRLEVVLLEAPDVDRYQQAIEETIQETEEILGTFNALLTIAQAEAGSRREDVQLLDLPELVRDVADLYAPVAEEKGLDFGVRLTPGIQVAGNRHLLSQALANLLDNAIKYTPEGGSVDLTLARSGRGCLLSVADTGLGVPAEEREKVLRRFYRLEQSRSTPGSGLGLSLVAAVAGLHRAELQLHDTRQGRQPPGLTVELRFSRCRLRAAWEKRRERRAAT